MPSTIERLPAQILQSIAEILDVIHPNGLLAFARASKKCYAHASNLLYRTVKVAITDEERRLQDVHDVEKRLLRDDAFAHVRRLILYADRKMPRHPYLSLASCEKDHEDKTETWSCWDMYLGKRAVGQWRPPTTSLTDDEWESVTSLMGRLTGLNDLIWSCPQQLPPRLLQAMHEKAKLCRLHHCTFSLSSSTENALTSYERILVTSPCLYSIGDLRLGDSPIDITSALKLARTLQSPSLRRVYLYLRSDEIDRNDDGSGKTQSILREIIQLDTYFSRARSISFEIVRREASGDFSALRVLNLDIPIASRGLPAPSQFTSLVALTFTCINAEDATPEYWDEIITFLHNLPHLTTLSIENWDRAVSITPCLGPNLRKLSIHTRDVTGGPALRDDHIHQLADVCPNLEYAWVEIRRSRGDAAEVACYRSLGRLARLQELELFFDTSPPGYIWTTEHGDTAILRDTAIEPWFDQRDAQYLRRGFRPYRQGHVRDLFVNRAIDAGLARSIFEVIDSAKPKLAGSSRPLPLERLYIYPDELESLPSANMNNEWLLDELLGALRREWKAERDVRDDAREVIHVKNLDSNVKSISERRHLNKAKEDRYLFGLWQRVWPVERENVDWWDDWESRPLAVEDDVSRNIG